MQTSKSEKKRTAAGEGAKRKVSGTHPAAEQKVNGCVHPRKSVWATARTATRPRSFYGPFCWWLGTRPTSKHEHERMRSAHSAHGRRRSCRVKNVLRFACSKEVTSPTSHFWSCPYVRCGRRSYSVNLLRFGPASWRRCYIIHGRHSTCHFGRSRFARRSFRANATSRGWYLRWVRTSNRSRIRCRPTLPLRGCFQYLTNRARWRSYSNRPRCRVGQKVGHRNLQNRRDL